MKKSKKFQKNLDNRIKGYFAAVAILEKEHKDPNSYHKPGSRNGSK